MEGDKNTFGIPVAVYPLQSLNKIAATWLCPALLREKRANRAWHLHTIW
jgi:hypothetical protein